MGTISREQVDVYRQGFGKTRDYERANITSVSGKFAIHNPGWPDWPFPRQMPGPTRVLLWFDGGASLDLSGNNSQFSYDDMLRIAESIAPLERKEKSVDIRCVALDRVVVQAKEISFKVPKWLPEGYEFKCAMAIGPWVYLTFASIGTNVTRANVEEVAPSSIALFVGNTTRVSSDWGNAQARYENTRRSYPSLNVSLQVINGRPTYVREECRSCDFKIWRPGRIFFLDGSALYIIESNLPSNILVKMVESIG